MMKNSSIKSSSQLVVQDITVELTRKNVKNINLRVTQPEGRVRVSAPKRMPIDIINSFITSKHDWIVLQRERLRAYATDKPYLYESGEIHSFFDQQYELRCIDSKAKSKVVLNNGLLELHAKKRSTSAQRQAILESWYREQLKIHIPDLINKYERLIGLTVEEFGVKKMRTRWGTCNPKARRIWLNLELVKYPMECLEYVVLHEMTHFLETRHNQRFYNFVTNYMPDWKSAEQKLSLSQ